MCWEFLWKFLWETPCGHFERLLKNYRRIESHTRDIMVHSPHPLYFPLPMQRPAIGRPRPFFPPVHFANHMTPFHQPSLRPLRRPLAPPITSSHRNTHRPNRPPGASLAAIARRSACSSNARFRLRSRNQVAGSPRLPPRPEASRSRSRFPRPRYNRTGHHSPAHRTSRHCGTQDTIRWFRRRERPCRVGQLMCPEVTMTPHRTSCHRSEQDTIRSLTVASAHAVLARPNLWPRGLSHRTHC